MSEDRPPHDGSFLVVLSRDVASMTATMAAIKELISKNEISSQRQFDRIDQQVREVKDDQRNIDKKVDTWQAEAKRLIDKAIAQGEKTEDAVRAMTEPLDRWRKMESRINAWWLLVPTALGILAFLWPLIKPNLHLLLN